MITLGIAAAWIAVSPLVALILGRLLDQRDAQMALDRIASGEAVQLMATAASADVGQA
jgi:hypothetical protein